MALAGDDVAGDERGDQGEPPDGHELEHDERGGEAGLPQILAEGDVGGPSGAEDEREHECDRDDHGGAETEVGALLCPQFEEFPLVDEDGAPER